MPLTHLLLPVMSSETLLPVSVLMSLTPLLPHTASREPSGLHAISRTSPPYTNSNFTACVPTSQPSTLPLASALPASSPEGANRATEVAARCPEKTEHSPVARVRIMQWVAPHHKMRSPLTSILLGMPRAVFRQGAKTGPAERDI